MCSSESSGLESAILNFYLRSGRTVSLMGHLDSVFEDLSNDVSIAILFCDQGKNRRGDNPLRKQRRKIGMVVRGLIEHSCMTVVFGVYLVSLTTDDDVYREVTAYRLYMTQCIINGRNRQLPA